MKCSLQRWTLLKSDVSWKLCWSQGCWALLRCLFSMCAVQAVCQSHISVRSVLITSLVLGLAEVFVLSMCAVWAVCWLLKAEGPCRSGEGPCNRATVATYALHSPLVSWHMCYARNLSTTHLLSHKPDLTSTHMHELKLMYKLPFLKSVPNFDTDAIFLDSWCVCEQHHSTHPCNVLLQITKSLTVLLLGNVVCLFCFVHFVRLRFPKPQGPWHCSWYHWKATTWWGPACTEVILKCLNLQCRSYWILSIFIAENSMKVKIKKFRGIPTGGFQPCIGFQLLRRTVAPRWFQTSGASVVEFWVVFVIGKSLKIKNQLLIWNCISHNRTVKNKYILYKIITLQYLSISSGQLLWWFQVSLHIWSTIKLWFCEIQ